MSPNQFIISFLVYSNVPSIGQEFVFAFINAETDYPPHGVLLYAIVSNTNNATANVLVTSSFPDFMPTRVSVAPFSIYKVRLYCS